MSTVKFKSVICTLNSGTPTNVIANLGVLAVKGWNIVSLHTATVYITFYSSNGSSAADIKLMTPLQVPANGSVFLAPSDSGIVGSDKGLIIGAWTDLGVTALAANSVEVTIFI